MNGCDAKAGSEVEIEQDQRPDDRVQSQVILPYMCQPYPEGKMTSSDVKKEFQYHTIRNGQTITTQHFTNGGVESSYIRMDRGLHEPANNYQAYIRRKRSKGKWY